MKKSLAIALVVVFSFITVGFASQMYFSNNEETTSVMIRYENSLMRSNLNTSETIGNIDIIDATSTQVTNLKEEESVEYIEPNSIVKKSSISDDWYLDYDNIRDIYSDLSLTGNSVKVAILDTGITFSSGKNVSGGINIIDKTKGYEDDNGHGSAMANIISSIAPEAELYSVKVLDEDGLGLYSNVISGINWALNNDIDIICMSFGSFSYSYFLEEAIDTAFNSGIVMIAASGNDSSEKMHYPAAYNQVISVGACTETGELLDFTNGKEDVDIYAPGVNIKTENHRGVLLQNKGTSVSAAQVVGVSTLMKSAKPDYNIEDLYTVLNHSSRSTDKGIKILDGYNAISEMNAFIDNPDEYIPTLDKNYIETEDGQVAISYKVDGYDNKTIKVNDSVTVRAGFYSAHDYCDITVYKSTNTSNILASTRRSPISGGAYVTYTCPEDVLSSVGTYYIRYHASGNGTNTQYDDVFTVYVESINPDSYESNNTFSASTLLSRTSTSIYANISSSSDKDYYKLFLNEGETVTLNLTNLDRDYELRLYKPDQTTATSSTHGGIDDENITYTANLNGYYYIYVYGYSGACCSTNYKLNYSVSSPVDEYELHKNGVGATIYNNDTYSNCTNLSATNELIIHPTISSKNDIDWFSFVAPKGQVTIELSNLPYDYELYLYSNATTQLAYSAKSGTSDEVITYKVTEDYQTLYINVVGYENNASIIPYTLRIAFGYINSTIFDITKNSANIRWSTSYSGPSVVNYGITTSISNTTKNDTWVKSHSINLSYLSSATKYYYKAQTISSARSESKIQSFYTGDRYEPNNTLSTATSITSADQVFNGTIHERSDEDYFKVTLSRPGIMYLSLENIPIGCDYDLWLADEYGNEITNSSLENNNGEYIELLVPPGKYYIAIDSFSSYKGDETYSFTYDFEPINFNDVFITDELHFGGDGTYSPTGNYSKTFEDLNFTNSAYDYYVGRTYNSKDKTTKHFGRGWMFSFEGKVSDLERTFEYSNGNVGTQIDENYKMVKLPDATSYIFEKQSDGTFVAQDSRSTLAKDGNTFVFTTKEKDKYIFNSSGYLTTMKDKYGNTINIIVSSDGKVQSFTDPTENTYTVSYGTNSYISSVTESSTGRTISYQYTNGNLTSVVDASGIYTYYEYDSDNYITAIKNNQQYVMEALTYSNVSNEPKKINTVTDGYGNIMTYSYNSSENKTTITDSNGRITTQSYDSTKFITNIVDAAGRTKVIEYSTIDNKNKYGEISSVTDELGNITAYQRDDKGNVTKVTSPDGSYMEYLYDNNNNVLWERDSIGNFTLYEYDSQGIKLTKKAKYLETVNSGQTVALTSSNSNLFAIEEYTYYSDSTASIKGLLYQYKNAEGVITQYSYDSHGNPLTVKDPETALTTNYTYNELNYNLTKTTPRGFGTQYMYDNMGNVVKETNVSDNGVKRTVYDVNGRKVLEVKPNQYNATNDTLSISENINAYSDYSSATSYEYYSNGLLKKTVSPEGDAIEYVYDSYGNIISETLPCQFDENNIKKQECGQYIYEYDNLNRLIAKKYKETLSSDEILLESITYGKEQNANEYLSTKTTTTYYSQNDFSTVTEKSKFNDKITYIGYSDGSSESYTYYDDGELKTYTDGNGNTTYYKYNILDNNSGNIYHEVWTPSDGGYSYARTDYDLSGNKFAEFKSQQVVGLYTIPQNLYSRNYVYYKNAKLKLEYDSEGRKTEYEYDNDGNLTKTSVYTTESEKNVTQYVNNANGLPVTETVNISSDTLYNDTRTTLVTSYTYDLNGNVLSKTTPNGVSVTTTYDKQNRAVSTSQPLTNENGTVETAIVEQRYNSKGDVYYLKDARGGETQYIYDNRGICIKEINALDGVTFKNYDYAGRLTNLVKPRAYSVTGTLLTMDNTEYFYNSKNLLVKQIEHYYDDTVSERKDVITKQISYDSCGNVLTETDALGYVTSYTYTPSNKIKTKLDAQSTEGKLAYSINYSYNGIGQVISQTNANGIQNVVSYDYMGNILNKSLVSGENTVVLETNTYGNSGNLLTQTDANNNTVTYTYNKLNKVGSIHFPYDDTIAENIVNRKYGLNGQIIFEDNSTGCQTIFEYDEAGRNTSITLQDENKSLSSYTKYDLSGNKRKEVDGNGNITEHIFDLLNRETSTVKNGKTTQYSYDLNSNLISVTDWRENVSNTTYDALDRVKNQYDAYGKLISEKSYNVNGIQISDKDALGAITAYQYDKNNRLIATIDPLNNTTQIEYDNIGNVTCEIDAKGNRKEYAYDSLNRLITVTQQVNGINENTTYTYDNCGNMLSQTDGEGKTTSFEYNSVNLLSKKIYSGGSTDITKQESYMYFADGTLSSKTDRNRKTISYEYDLANRQTQMSTENISVSSNYDNSGNKLNMTDVSGNTVRTFDAEGRVITKVQPQIGTFSYSYDITSNVSEGEYAESSINPANLTNRKVYDRAGRLHYVYDGEMLSATYVYIDNGALQKVVYGNGATEEYTYFANGLLNTLVNKNSLGEVTDNYSYTYDANGNQTSKTEFISGVTKGTTSYTYDGLNRLKTITEPSGKITEYAYDKSGNRISENIIDGSITIPTIYSYNELNQLVKTVATYSDIIISFDYQYDNNGNLYSKIKSTQGSEGNLEKIIGMTIAGETEDGISQYTEFYEYDDFNQLTKVTKGASTNVYTYNGEGMRISKNVNSNMTYFGYEFDKAVVEYNGSQFTAINLFGTNLINRTAGNQTMYYQFNGHADVVGLTDNLGILVASYYYDAFGVPIEQSGDVSNPFRYGGYVYDEETGLYYIKSRFYDASIARFIQEDVYTGKYSDPLSLNLYTYVLNNPLRYLDPTGMIPDEIRVNGNNISYLKGSSTGIYGSLRDLVDAYGGKINYYKGIYSTTINNYTFTLDTNGIGKISGDKSVTRNMTVKYEGRQLDSNYFVAVRDKNNSNSIKLLVNVDFFVSKVGQSHDECVKYYSNLSTFTNDISDLGKLAISYNGNNKIARQLTFQQLRTNKYSGENWDVTGNEIDLGFTNYILNENRGDLNFEGQVLLKDPKTKNYIDVNHMAATINAYLYETRWNVNNLGSWNGLKAKGAGDGILDNLAGWAGDLQSLIGSLQANTSNSDEYDKLYHEAYKLIGNESYNFGMQDMLADIDAVNISKQLKDNPNKRITNIFSDYYTAYVKRYSLFAKEISDTSKDDKIKEKLRKEVRYYTNPTFMFVVEWPLYGIFKEYDVTDNQGKALGDAFTHFIDVNIER